LLFGAWLSSPSKAKSKLDSLSEEKGKPLNSICDTLFNEANGDADLFIEYMNRFSECVKPLKKELDKWHTWLLKEWVKDKNVKYKAKSGKDYVKNPTGKALCIDDLIEKYTEWEVKSKLASFKLLGREACFIHNLTILSKEYKFQVIANEHDGLVCIGNIPEEAVQRAAEMSGLVDPILEEKPFDITEIENLIEEDDEITYDWEEKIADS
jgi:hypothetical protein